MTRIVERFASRVSTGGAMEHLAWPFFEERHRDIARELAAWCGRALDPPVHPTSPAVVDVACRDLVQRLGEGGWLRLCVPAASGGAFERLDVRALCLAREILAARDALADFAFAMQGLGSGPISLHGSKALRARWLPRVSAGGAIAAFALSEAGAGSDVRAMRTTAHRADGGGYVLHGEKTWISNAGLADFYVIFARWPEGGKGRFVALVVEADAPGLAVTHRVEVTAPHPLGTLSLDGCRVGADAVVGEPGRGLRVALGTLAVFRPTVGAAALGFARRALGEALDFARSRSTFGLPIAEHQLTQARLAQMAVDVDASALLVYRAAWRHDAGDIERAGDARDTGAARDAGGSRDAAMAKLFATEAAQRVVDGAVQLLGARGVVRESTVERLYREVRALRIYEGTSEIQQLVIAGEMLREASREMPADGPADDARGGTGATPGGAAGDVPKRPRTARRRTAG